MNSLSLHRLKLFSKLDTEEVVSQLKKECCTASFTKVQIFMLDEAFWLRSTLSNIKESSLFYI